MNDLEKQIAYLYVIIIVLILALGFSIWKADRDKKNSFETGWSLGQEQTVKYIQGFGRIPYYNFTGGLEDISIQDLCNQLNQQQGG